MEDPQEILIRILTGNATNGSHKMSFIPSQKNTTLVRRHFTESINCTDGHPPFSGKKVGLVRLSTMA